MVTIPFPRATLAVLAGGMVAFTHPLTAQAVGEVGIPIGSEAQAVRIEDLDGHPVDLSQYLGHQPMLLEFWATWCENCKALLPELEEAHRQFGDRVRFLAVSVAVNQSKRSIKRHLEQEPVPWDVLWDTRGRATRAFKAPATSYVAIVDSTGTVAYTGIGPSQPIVETLKKLLGT